MTTARMALLALAAFALLAAPASAAKLTSCGNYARNDGSLADGVVLKIKVVGMSCRTGQVVANGYHGLIGPFKAYGFKCDAQQAGDPPQQAGSVRCVKGRQRMSYQNGPMTDCSTTPGVLVPQGTGTPISGPWTYNTDCQTAVMVVNSAAGEGPAPAGWTCADNTDTDDPAGSCIMASGTAYDVVQWDDNVQAPGNGTGLP
jgi:hypothetical protein